MALLPNRTFERNQVAGGRQAVEQTQLRNNAARANTPAQAGVQPPGAGLDLGNAPLSRLAQNTPEFLNNVGRDASIDAGEGIMSRLAAAGVDQVTGAARAIGQGIGNIVNNPTAEGSGFETQRPTPGPGAGIGTLFGTPTAQGSGFETQRPTPGPGRSPSFPSLPNAPATREMGQRPGPPQSPGVNGGSVPTPGAGAGPGRSPSGPLATTPGAGAGPGRSPSGPLATTPAQVSDDALQGAVQAGGSAAGMGYWAREGGPRNYIPGTQANDSNLSVMPMGGGAAGGLGVSVPQDSRFRNVGGSGPGGAYLPGQDPMYMDPNRNAGGSNQVTILGDSGAPGGGGLNGAIDAYLSASPGGGSEGSRRRQQLRNVMEALAGREDTNTRAGATVQSANIGANADLQTTGMTQAGANQRNQADNAIRWDANNATWAELESNMGGDPLEALRLARAQEAYAAGDDPMLTTLLSNSQVQQGEPLFMDPASPYAGMQMPDGSIRMPTLEELAGFANIGALPQQQRQQVLQGGGR